MRHQQMHVIGHQHAGVYHDAAADSRLTQVGQATTAIRVVEEAWLPIVATLYNMLRHTGKIRAEKTSHGEISDGDHHRKPLPECRRSQEKTPRCV